MNQARIRRPQAYRTRDRLRWLAIGGLVALASFGLAMVPGMGVIQPMRVTEAGPAVAIEQGSGRASSPLLDSAAAAPTPGPPRPMAPARPAPVRADAQFLSTLQTDLATRWVRNHTETPLRSGPDAQAITFTTLPQWSLLRVVRSRADGLDVTYAGDGATRQPGPGWVSASAVGAVDTPSIWLAAQRPIPLWSDASLNGSQRLVLPASTSIEVVVPGSVVATRIHVRVPGDGRGLAPAEGWVDAAGMVRRAALQYSQLPAAYPAVVQADLRLPVLYRSQLDGSSYAGANCGPAALGMVLEGLGINVSSADLRADVLRAQGDDPSNDDQGSFVWSLAQVAQQRGVRADGLRDGGTTALHRWTADEVRASLRLGRPVVLQVRYRFLPGRETSLYYGDHFVVITGLLGDAFLYDDPIGGAAAGEVPGWDRLISTADLTRAMNASDQAYAYSGFALGKA